MTKKISRIDVIGLNGNDGLIYKVSCKDCGVVLTTDNWWPSWKKSNNQRCISCGKERHNSWDTKDKMKDRYLRNAFGLTLEEFNELLGAQDNKCAICNSSIANGKGTFHVDHNHNTGNIRGLLCHYCNVGLGNFRDNKILLEKAIKYLENNDEQ